MDQSQKSTKQQTSYSTPSLSTPAPTPISAYILGVCAVLVVLLAIYVGATYVKTLLVPNELAVTFSMPDNDSTEVESTVNQPDTIETTETEPLQETVTMTYPSVEELSIGDTIGAFTVTKTQIHGTAPHDGSKIFEVNLSGETVISGTVLNGMGGPCMKIDPEDVALLPSVAEFGKSLSMVCASEDSLLSTVELGVTDPSANPRHTIKIKNFRLYSAPMGAPKHSADFVELIN